MQNGVNAYLATIIGYDKPVVLQEVLDENAVQKKTKVMGVKWIFLWVARPHGNLTML